MHIQMGGKYAKSVALSPAVVKRIEDMAKEQHRSFTRQAELLLEEALKHYPEQPELEEKAS